MPTPSDAKASGNKHGAHSKGRMVILLLLRTILQFHRQGML